MKISKHSLLFYSALLLVSSSHVMANPMCEKSAKFLKRTFNSFNGELCKIMAIAGAADKICEEDKYYKSLSCAQIGASTLAELNSDFNVLTGKDKITVAARISNYSDAYKNPPSINNVADLKNYVEKEIIKPGLSEGEIEIWNKYKGDLK